MIFGFCECATAIRHRTIVGVASKDVKTNHSRVVVGNVRGCAKLRDAAESGRENFLLNHLPQKSISGEKRARVPRR
jgi:hypothetical protein